MQNLDQTRAAKALEAINRDGSKITKQAVNKLPAMIVSNGLLASLAFADEPKKENEPKRPEMQDAMNQVAQHLSHPIHGIGVLARCDSAKKLLQALTTGQADSLSLQRATTEALAFLGYLKRFAVKESTEATETPS
jgi:CRISPR-associated protein Cmr5